MGRGAAPGLARLAIAGVKRTPKERDLFPDPRKLRMSVYRRNWSRIIKSTEVWRVK